MGEQQMTVRVKLAAGLWQRLRIRAAEQRTSARELAAEAIRQFLEKKRRTRPPPAV